MGIRIKSKCRGEAKFYILLESSESLKGFFATSFVRGGDKRLPARTVLISDTSLVVVLMGFAVDQRVQLFDAEGRRVLSFWVVPQIFALSSKINGVVRREQCSRIRNIDASGLACFTSVLLDAFVPTDEGFLIRCRLANCKRADAFGIVAMDENGATIGRGVEIAQDSSTASERLGDSFFSVAVPFYEGALCLSVVDQEGEPVGAFFGLEKKELSRRLELCRKNYETAFTDSAYPDWLAGVRLTELNAFRQKKTVFERMPLFSIIVPLYRTPPAFFRDMADSVLAQTYQRWELILVNSTPDDDELTRLVDWYANADRRIKVCTLEENYGITINTSYGIDQAKGDYLCFFDHDDLLEPDILFEYAKAINSFEGIDLLYCDEDKLLPDGSFGNPTFKPDFSLDMLRDNNFVCHLMTVRRGALDGISPSGAELDGAQDHAMVLKIAELGGRIHHVPKILYHWRISENSTAGNADSKPYANVAGIRAVGDHLARVGTSASVELSHGRSFRYLPDYDVPSGVSVSLIVPTRGNRDTVRSFLNCVSSASYIGEWQIVFVCSAENEAAIKGVSREFSLDVSVVLADCDFNYSSWMNRGARCSSGDVIVFVHDDIVPANPDWIRVLSGFACRDDVGVVGTMSCDFDGVIQQAGLSFVDDRMVCLSRGFHDTSVGYIFLSSTVREVAAVSGVCLASSRASYDVVGGFDEGYSLDYADVDYCFLMEKKGLKVIYTPEAKLYHRANTNRCLFGRHRSSKHFEDKALLLSKWSHRFGRGDCFFSPSFSKKEGEAETYKLAKPEVGIG